MANRDYVLSATLELKDKLTGKLNDARKGLEGVKGSAAAASGALDGVGTSAVKAAAGTGRLKSALSGVKGTYQATVGVKDEASGKLSAIKNGVRELAGRASAVTVRMRDEVSGKLTRIKEELAGLTGKTYTAMVNVKQNGGLSKLKEGMSGFAGGMLMNTPMQMAGAAGIGFGMYDALKTYSNFESEISGIKALTNMSGEQMAMVRDKAKELGAATRYSSVEAAQGMSELLKAGIDVKDVMGDASQAALDLASAGDLALPEAASVMSTAMNAFHMDDATHVADILAGAANASATDVHELSYALSAVSAVAAGAGMSFDDTNTALAVFAQNGLKGSRCLFMHIEAVVSCQIIFKRASFRIVIFLIHFAGGNSVAYHFHEIRKGHFHCLPFAVNHILVVFPVMSVASLVMQPAFGIAEFLLLVHVGRAVTLKIADADKQLSRGIFGKIMGKTLSVQSAFEAVLHDFIPVCIDCMQVQHRLFQ